MADNKYLYYIIAKSAKHQRNGSISKDRDFLGWSNFSKKLQKWGK